MGTASTKESRLNIRCDNRSRQLLDKAAGYAHVSVSEFVLSHALASAERVVQAHESITLKPHDFEAFLAALDAPAKAKPALKRAYKRHAAQVRPCDPLLTAQKASLRRLLDYRFVWVLPGHGGHVCLSAEEMHRRLDELVRRM